MKKVLILIILLATTSSSSAKLYVCVENGCRTTIIQDNGGFAWNIQCDDYSYASGYVQGAIYDGNCEELTIP